MTPWLMHSAEFDRFNAFCVCPLNLCILKSDVQRKAQYKFKKLNSSIKMSLSKPKSEARVFHWTAMIRDITPTNVAVAFFGWLKYCQLCNCDLIAGWFQFKKKYLSNKIYHKLFYNT